MLFGCASSSDAIQRLEDGSYRLECRGTLATCLAQAEKQCASYGYEVLSGRQETRVFGPEQVQSKHFSSEAIVMCRNADGWFDNRPQPARAAETSDVPQPPWQVATCVPGASQSCTGPGGCKGGQTCALDGHAYLPCDCGEAAEPPQSPSSEQPSAATSSSAQPSDPGGMPAQATTQPVSNPAAPEPNNDPGAGPAAPPPAQATP